MKVHKKLIFALAGVILCSQIPSLAAELPQSQETYTQESQQANSPNLTSVAMPNYPNYASNHSLIPYYVKGIYEGTNPDLTKNSLILNSQKEIFYPNGNLLVDADGNFYSPFTGEKLIDADGNIYAMINGVSEKIIDHEGRIVHANVTVEEKDGKVSVFTEKASTKQLVFVHYLTDASSANQCWELYDNASKQFLIQNWPSTTYTLRTVEIIDDSDIVILRSYEDDFQYVKGKIGAFEETKILFSTFQNEFSFQHEWVTVVAIGPEYEAISPIEISKLTQEIVEKTQPTLDHHAQVIEGITLIIQDKKIDLKENILVDQNRMMLSLRTLTEALGLEVGYNAPYKTALIVKDGVTMEFPLGCNVAIINGTEIVKIDETNDKVTAIASDSRTYLPIRFIAEQLGLKVDFHNQTITIHE